VGHHQQNEIFPTLATMFHALVAVSENHWTPRNVAEAGVVVWHHQMEKTTETLQQHPQNWVEML